MSNSLSPKKAPNVFNQETLERALVVLRQPFSIAVLASLAAHGLLWTALPNLFTQPKEPETQRQVKVVELSPAEQGQLPQFGINPLPQTLVPVKPLQPAQSGTKLPDPKFSNDPLLDTLPVFQLPPPNLSLPDFSKLLSPNVTEPKKEPKKPATRTNREKNPPPSEPETPKKDSGTTRDKDETPARQATLSSERIAELQKQGERSRQLRELYTFNGSATDDGIRIGEVLPKNGAAFEDAVVKAKGSNYDRSSYSTPERKDIPFPQEACSVMKEPFLKKIQIVSIAAYFNPDGTLEGKPGLLLTSGFKGLDQLAFDYANGVALKPSDQPRLVRFDVRFDPRTVCTNSSKPT